MKAVIMKAIHELPSKYRIVFTLRDMEGFNTEETAGILNITPQLVKTRLHRARFALRKTISDRFKGGWGHGA
jgi:RNA polymerase sigma-70 factor (ECF subfamily)